MQRVAIYCNVLQHKMGEISEMATAKQKIKKICEYCGKGFEADKISTKYCSHKCNSAAYKTNRRKVAVKQSEELTAKNKTATLVTDLSNRDYLSISEAAKLFGLNRSTVYRYVISGIIPGIRITKRTTRIKQSDLNVLFERVEKYEINPKTQERKPISEWYTLDEITEKYGIKYRQIRKIINTESIPEKKYGRFTMIAKNHVDVYFKKKGYNESIMNLSEWLTIPDIMQEYKMTENTTYSFLSDYRIPKKQENGKRYYSKQHIDQIKNKKP